jgi:hypothetical protein
VAENWKKNGCEKEEGEEGQKKDCDKARFIFSKVQDPISQPNAQAKNRTQGAKSYSAIERPAIGYLLV